MTDELCHLTNYRLAALLEEAREKVEQIYHLVFEEPHEYHERWNDVVARMGEDHSVVKAYRTADAVLREVQVEASMRVGPGHYESSVLLYLRQSPRYRRVPPPVSPGS